MHPAGVDGAPVSINGVNRPADARARSHVPGVLVRALAAFAAVALLVPGLATPAGAAPASAPAAATPAAATPAAATPAAAPRAAEDAGEGGTPPLSVTIESMTPSTVPRRGPITLTGEITNDSDETWTDLDVYLFAAGTPITTSEELAEGTGSDAALDVGGRLTAPGQYDEVRDLEPGESTGYRLTVPRGALGFREPGVYWIGVHVLGTSPEGRLAGADGRARTFIPLMDPRGPRATASLVVPLRAAVRRTSQGRLENVPSWHRRLSADGQLRRLLDLARTGDDVPLTWLVDPAVLGAVASLAEGNPDFDLAPTAEASAPPSEGVVTESPGPDAPEEPDEPAEELSKLGPEAEAAGDWLADFTEVSARHGVLNLPYGDVDESSLLRGGYVETFTTATDLGARAMADLGIEASPVVAPLGGAVPEEAVPRLPADTPLLLSEGAVETESGVVRLPGGVPTVVTSDVARRGGPAPTSPYAALALRQQILAEAAVRALTGDASQPLVVSMPDQWDPGEDWRAADFFEGLDVPWLSLMGLSAARATTQAEAYAGPLRYDRASRRTEIPDANILATQDLEAAGSLLGELLTGEDTIHTQVGQAAMLGSSVNARRAPHRAVVSTRRIAGEVHRRLSQVTIEGSPLVTMSSGNGNFSVTLVNGLDEPVTVGVTAETGSDDLEIGSPDLVALGPGQRASVRLAVTATDTGVHSVRLLPTTRDGRALGHSTTVKVRSSQVGLVIWLVMGVGGVVFVAAIILRIWRRIRAGRHPESGAPERTA